MFSCINNYMSNNHFEPKELYSFITGKTTTAIARKLVRNFRQAGLDITVEQWSVLYRLWKEDGVSQQQLCEDTFRDKASITRLVDNLEKMDLVERVSSRKDRRKKLVFLSDAGRGLREKSMAVANQTLNEALAGVSPDEVAMAKMVLQKVYDNLA